MVLGVGDSINETELRAIASADYFFRLSSFEELNVSISAIISTICNSAYVAGMNLL